MTAAQHRSKRTRARSAVRTVTSAETLRRATGRERDDWFALLDAWGAAGREHREIAAWLIGEHAVAGWWAQTLTVDYERARGLRPPGGSRDGTFTVNASRTMAVPVARLFAAFVDAKQRQRWLPGVVMRVRTAQQGRSARFDWEDGATRVIVGFDRKGAGRSLVALAHERLPNARAAEKTRAYWRERLAALKVLLEGLPRG
jgi:hypothetical protein